jgi:hypothetical protein
LQLRNTFASALADLLLRVSPALKRQLCIEISATELSKPRSTIDELRGDSAQLVTPLVQLASQLDLVESCPPVDLLPQLAPAPRNARIPGNGSAGVNTFSPLNGTRPIACHGTEPLQERGPSVKQILLVPEFSKLP